MYLRDRGQTEIGAFGISHHDDPLNIRDLAVLKQVCTPVSVAFDDSAVADFFDECVDEGGKPEHFARIWLHTHPGNSPLPSPTDEETFARVFGRCDWAVMFILAAGGEMYARLRFSAGPGAQVHLKTVVDFEHRFPAADFNRWNDEYQQNVQAELLSQHWPRITEQRLADLAGVIDPGDLETEFRRLAEAAV